MLIKRLMRQVAIAAMVVGTSLPLLAPRAEAALVHYRYDFTGAFSSPAPQTTVTGFLDVSFDTAVSFGPSQSGFTAQTSLGYTPLTLAYDSATSLLRLGTSVPDKNSCNINSNDFCLTISNPSSPSTAVIGTFAYRPASSNLFFASTKQLTVTPIPAALPLLASGIAGLGWLRRRQLFAA
ncbi:MAG: VPLPA-CTERM sorting domain-containing protein [Geminicoccaceae bacterium]